MTPAVAARLMDLYDRAAEAAVADDIRRATALVAEAGAVLADPLPVPPEDPAARRAVAALAGACAEARASCAAALAAARLRLQARAAADLRSGSAAGHYAAQRTPDARFIDRRS